MSATATVEQRVGEVAKSVTDVTTSITALRAEVEAQKDRFKTVEERLEKARLKVRTPWGDEGKDERRCSAFRPEISLTALYRATVHRLGGRLKDGTRMPPPNKDEFIRNGHYPEAFEVVERAMLAGQLDSGGYLIPEEYMADIVPALLPRARVLQAGVPTLNVGAGVGQIRWPKQNSRPTVSSVPEATAATESTPTWTSKVAVPHKLGMLMAVPFEILLMSNARVEAFLRTIMERELALEWDRQVLRGLGAANEILGVANTDSIQSSAVGANGGAITYNLMLALETLVRESNVPGESFGWITSPRGYREIRKILDTQNRPLFIVTHAQPGLQGATPYSPIGFPLFETTNIPVNLTKGTGTNLTELYFGDWAQSLGIFWGGLDVLASREATDGTNNAFTQQLLLIRAFQLADWIPFYEVGFGITPDMNSQ